MICSQRGVSGSGDYGYYSVDRWYNFNNGLDENPTIAQADLASSDTPFSSGFRKSLKVTNGNQTSGAGAADQTFISTTLEAQDIANSGWNYTSTSSYITLSFWVKASVAQTYYGFLKAPDGSNYIYPYSFALSANTWTKVTKTIAGNSNLQFDNNHEAGLEVGIYLFLGTNFTDSGVSLDTWAAYSSGATRTPDHTSTWYTTNDSTFEMTGVQLTVTDYCPDFPYETYGETLQKCKRYYQQIVHASSEEYRLMNAGSYGGTGQCYGVIHYPVEMRTAPSLAGGISGTSYWTHKRSYNNSSAADEFDTIGVKKTSTLTAELKGSGNMDSGQNGAWGTVYANNASASLGLHADF